jgi:hypothetical protein
MRKSIVMSTRKIEHEQFTFRARRCAREIGLAIALTLAGVVFLVAAFHRGGSETASITAPQAGIHQPPAAN